MNLKTLNEVSKESKGGNMKAENAKAQMRKGILEYCILLILDRGDAYASDIIQQLKESQMIVVEGTLYPLLTRQKNLGLLSYRWEESTQGPPRKYYALTEEGRNFLNELDAGWKELVHAIEDIKTAK
jgi:PadR family transcriptional regulator PadR